MGIGPRAVHPVGTARSRVEGFVLTVVVIHTISTQKQDPAINSTAQVTYYSRRPIFELSFLRGRILTLIQLYHSIVNGAWSVWGAWSAWGQPSKCSKSCGDGIQVRNRSCDHPSPSYGGLPCIGDSLQTASCNIQQCPGISYTTFMISIVQAC